MKQCGVALTEMERDPMRWYDFFSRPAVYVPSIEKARCDFGLKTTPLEKWVGETVAWYLENPLKGPAVLEWGVFSTHYDLRDKEVELCRRWRKEYGEFAASFIGTSPIPTPT